MEVYKVDKDVPIPETKQIALSGMEVGDSILFPLQRRRSVQTSASFLKRVEGKVFTVKKVDNINARVWRTK